MGLFRATHLIDSIAGIQEPNRAQPLEQCSPILWTILQLVEDLKSNGHQAHRTFGSNKLKAKRDDDRWRFSQEIFGQL